MIARFYVKTPFYMKCVDIREIPQALLFVHFPALYHGQVDASFRKVGYDKINDEHIYINDDWQMSNTQSKSTS